MPRAPSGAVGVSSPTAPGMVGGTTRIWRPSKRSTTCRKTTGSARTAAPRMRPSARNAPSEIDRRVRLVRAIADATCDALDWRRHDGRRKDMSARVALLRMADDGLLALPAPRHGNANGRIPRRLEPDPEPPPAVVVSLAELGRIELVVVDGPAASMRWRTLIATHHYLGYTPFAGAQLRYLVETSHGTVAALEVRGLGVEVRGARRPHRLGRPHPRGPPPPRGRQRPLPHPAPRARGEPRLGHPRPGRPPWE